MMHAEFLMMAADLLLVGMMELLLSWSRSMGMPKSLWAVQPSMRVAAMPVEAYALIVCPSDCNLMERAL